LTSIVSLVIGRGGSSFKNKNIRKVLNYPLVLWTCSAAKKSKYINGYYCSSDSIKILNTCKSIGYKAIKRPKMISKASSQSCDAVRHAIRHIEKDIKKKIEIVVVQHANVGTIKGSMIDECIDLLKSNPKASAVVPSHEKMEYHPARAKYTDSKGFFKQAIKGNFSANRQELEKVYFFDHSFWVIRRNSAVKSDGQRPWNCMGNKILPYITNGCLDVHDENDILQTEKWIKDNKILKPKLI
tara:strand:- start:252 stop:974 length:723 start_codon:yes stop_codon:yes gene_type:complete